MALGFSACGGVQSNATSDGTPAVHCPEPPRPATPRAVDVPTSTMGVAVSIDIPTLLEALHRELPVVVAEEERRPIGAPGLVSYTIRRSKLKLSHADEFLALSTTLSGDVHICKPFAGACITYGVCEPRWEVTAKLARDFDALTDLLPELEVKLTEGCTLRPVGYNATPILEQHTEREAARISARLRRTFNAWLSEIDDAWRRVNTESSMRWQLAAATEGLEYRPLRITGDTLSAAVAWRGQLLPRSATPDPATQRAQGLPLPALSRARWQRRESLLPKTRWVSSSTLSYEALQQQVSAAWRLEANAETRDVRLVTAQQGGGFRLVLGLPTPDACAWVWLPVTPTLANRSGTSEAPGLVLVPITAASSGPAEAAARWLSTRSFEWTPLTEGAPGAALELMRQSLTDLSARIEPQRNASFLRLAFAPPIENNTFQMGPSGLTLVTAVDTDIQWVVAP